jgi:hypothetical protein
MLKRLLRIAAFALPLLAFGIAVTDGPLPDCYPCDDGGHVAQL